MRHHKQFGKKHHRDRDPRRGQVKKAEARVTGPLPSPEQIEVWLNESVSAAGAEILEFKVRFADQVRCVIDRDNAPLETEFLIGVLRAFKTKIREAGFDPDDLEIEFDSPGETRLLNRTAHFERFKGSTVRIEFTDLALPAMRAKLQDVRDGKPVIVDPSGAERVLEFNEVGSIRLAP